MQKNLSVLLALASILSCQKHKNVEIITPLNMLGESLKINDSIPDLKLKYTEATIISIPEETKSHSIEEYISEYHYIRLETTDQCLIGRINKLCTDSSFVFVFDKANGGAFCFSDNGKFLVRFGRRGRGPNEFVELSDMSLDIKKKEVCLLDLSGGKLLFYSYAGKFLRTIPLYYHYNGLEFLDDKVVLSTAFSTNSRIPSIDRNRLVLANVNQRPLSKGFPYHEKLRDVFHWEDAYSVTRFGQKIFFHHILSDTIWQVDQGLCTARYILKFPKRDRSFELKEIENMTDELFSLKTKKSRTFFGRYLITNEFVFLGITNQERVIEPLIYCKSSGNYLYGLSSYQLPLNELKTMMLGNSFDFVYDEHSFVKVIQPFSVLHKIKSMQNRNYSPRLSKEDQLFVENLNEEDNPILMIVKLKQF